MKLVVTGILASLILVVLSAFSRKRQERKNNVPFSQPLSNPSADVTLIYQLLPGAHWDEACSSFVDNLFWGLDGSSEKPYQVDGQNVMAVSFDLLEDDDFQQAYQHWQSRHGDSVDKMKFELKKASVHFVDSPSDRWQFELKQAIESSTGLVPVVESDQLIGEENG